MSLLLSLGPHSKRYMYAPFCICVQCVVLWHMYVCTYVQEVATADIAFHFDVLSIDYNCYPSSTESYALIDICCYFG